MPAALTLRPSACPSLYRLAPARDGFIARIKLPLGHLVPEQARAIAAAAGRFGNGVIEITSRANLQVRGLAEADGDAFAAALADTGLAADPAADDVRNVMVSPTHSCDSAAILDTEPLARRLLGLLTDTPRYHRLSPKFSIGIDGGEAAMPRQHPHDIWLAALDKHTFALGLAGAPAQAQPLGVIAMDKAEATIAALLDLALARNAFRMRDLVAQAAPDAIRAALPALADCPALPFRASGTAPIGAFAGMAGARPPLGRVTPEMLLALAGLGAMRLTPWQSVLFTGLENPGRRLAELAALGLATAPEQPLARIIACSGSTGCPSALADTQADALALAAQLGPAAPHLHLSGCGKSCAAARALPVTLLAVAPDRYDLYCEDEGAESRFGRRIGQGLDLAAIAGRLADI